MGQSLPLSENAIHATLRYCVPCKYTQRAAWMASELLSRYPREITSFELVPGTGGEFEFSINGELAYSKKETGEFPELDDLAQLVVAAVEESAGA